MLQWLTIWVLRHVHSRLLLDILLGPLLLTAFLLGEDWSNPRSRIEKIIVGVLLCLGIVVVLLICL